MYCFHKSFLFGLLVSFVFLLPVDSFGQSLKCPVDYGYQWTRSFGNAKAWLSVGKLSEIDPAVAQRINEQLRKRVGDTFFKRLKFEYGRADDLDSSEPLKADQSKRIDGYDFVFEFSDRKKGLSAFHFKIEVDGSGKIFEKTLPLPDISEHPEKSILISCQQAMAIAKRNGFTPKRSSLIFVYDWDADVFTWVVTDSKEVQPDQPSFLIGGTYRKIDIEAHSGRVLKIYKETIVV